jgi:predicted  nucleic acid-binding Zn-ribbon protein
VKLDAMTVLCPNCGKSFEGTDNMGPCPNCGWRGIRAIVDTAKNYSGSVAVSSYRVSVEDTLLYAKRALEAMAEWDCGRAKYITPTIKELEETFREIQKQQASFLISKKSDWKIYEEKLAEYGELVDKCAEEPIFQEFFEGNANFLEPTFKTAYPKYKLADELTPDFLLVLYDSSYLFVEIEKPGIPLFNKKGNPSGELTLAQQQMRTYLKWVADNKAFLKDRECKNLTGDNFRGLLVVGRSADLSGDQLGKLENIKAEVRGRYEIKTFDEVLKENSVTLENIKKYLK